MSMPPSPPVPVSVLRPGVWPGVSSGIARMAGVAVVAVAGTLLVVRWAGPPVASDAAPSGAATPAQVSGSVPEPRPPPAPRGHSPARVRSLGRLVPGHGIVNVGGAAGAVVSRLLVTPGQVVKTAEVLAYLDTHAERVAEVNIARSRLGHTRETRAAELAAAEAAVGQARVQGERAEAVGPLQVAVQRSKVRALEVQVASALRDVERLDALRQEKNVSQQEYDRQKLVLDATREELGGAVALLAQLESQHACTVKEAQAQLRAALAQVDRVRSTYALEPVEMELKAAEARVERSLVKAPLDGQVLSVHTWPGETVGAAPVVRVGAVSRMYAVAEVYETDVHRVRVGQRATVRSPALPVELPGVVEEVGVTVSRNDVTGIDPGAATDTRVVEVRIRLQHNDVATRFNNLQVDVEIEAQ